MSTVVLKLFAGH